MRDIYRNIEREIRGDFNALVMRLDMERALQSNVLTPRQRQSIAGHYFACLNQQECASVIGITQQAVDARLKTALPALAAHMQGIGTRAPQLNVADDASGDATIDRWLRQVADNAPHWWRVPNDVFDEIRRRFQLAAGSAPVRINPDEVEYPFLTDSQMGWKWYKEISRPEIYPVFDNVGAKAGADGSVHKLVQAD